MKLGQMHLLWDEMELLLQKQRKLREQSVLKDSLLESVGIPEHRDDSTMNAQVFDPGNQIGTSTLPDRVETENFSMAFENHTDVFDAGTDEIPAISSGVHRLDDIERANSVFPMQQTTGDSLWSDLDRAGSTGALSFQTYPFPSIQSRQPDSFNFQLLDDFPSLDMSTPPIHDTPDNAQRGPSPRNTTEDTTRSIQSLQSFTRHSIPPLRLNSWLLDAFKTSEALPLLMFPPLPGDKHIHAILERARENVHSIGPPYIVDFLVDNPRNTLSTDLKTLLAPIRRTRGTSEFFATYWILYLLLRVLFFTR